MSKPVVAISDLHGCYHTFLALLDKARAKWGDFDLYLLGDLVDRGPRSREMVDYAMTNKVPTCGGNHEDLAVAYSEHTKMGYRAKCAKYYDQDVWLMNGGIEALESWGVDWQNGGGLPKDVLDWMAALPPYIIPDTPPDENGLKLLLSHTGYAFSADKGDWFTALWGRHGYDRGNFPNDGYYRVIGHTKRAKAHVTKTYANIDTGAAYEGHRIMTAFHWPSKETLEQETID